MFPLCWILSKPKIKDRCASVKPRPITNFRTISFDGKYAPSEPHGEEEFFRVGIYQKDECRRAVIIARRHFPLHNNEPELIDYFVSPLGSANQSALPEWNSNEAERLRATCESRYRSLCMSRRTNTR